MQIQYEERLAFDNVFAALGAYNIEMAVFSAFGKFISESGGPYILNECEVLSKGLLLCFSMERIADVVKQCMRYLNLRF